ncbi:piRNA biogenesis protein EXD1-like isoform X5 [Durio zibethinus]|uniref:PiRNA biogenesis protein EXD1-like isoform X5 n=1 Tax=Durio zibethinus TaxID=66656 RepID=A0A6P5ZPD2_DURZI|nr:piRNA biogenesis protein EXD1-like isoform X5 [Durio zibethinus]
MASSHPASHRTHVPLSSESGGNPFDNDAPPVPIHIVTDASQLPREFLNPSPKRQLVVGFDCEGIDLCRHGTLCIMQLSFPDAIYLVDAIEGGEMLIKACKPALESSYVTKVIHDCKRDSEALYFQFGIKLHNVMDTQIAYSLIEEQEGRTRLPDDYISFVGLLADPRYCGIYMSWHFLSGEGRVHGALYCQCFCVSDNNYADWPSVPPIPDNLITEGNAPEEEVLSILDVPQGKMGRVIGRKGASILSIKESCNAEIFLGGAKGPPDKVFIMGPVKQVRKAEAMLRGRMMD